MIKQLYLSLLPFLFVICFISDSSGFTVVPNSSKQSSQLAHTKDAVKEGHTITEIATPVSFKKKDKPRKRFFKSNTDPVEERKTDAFAIVAIVCAIGSFFIAGLILGLCAVAFSIVALLRIRKKPYKRKGKVLAWIALALGVVAFGIVAVYLASL